MTQKPVTTEAEISPVDRVAHGPDFPTLDQAAEAEKEQSDQ